MVVEQNLEGLTAQSEIFCLIICKMNIKIHIPEYDNELNELHDTHMTIVLNSSPEA